MKLSFSLSKTPAPKRVTQVQIPDNSEESMRREVVEISVDQGILVHKSEEEIEAEKEKTLVIPCKTLYTPREKRSIDVSASSTCKVSSGSTRVTGLILNSSYSGPSSTTVEVGSSKKSKSSILMQIMEARKRGEVQDAPTETVRSLDANEFGWALLRGMGYDESKETPEDAKATQTVVGNRAKLGIGVKVDPTNTSKN